MPTPSRKKPAKRAPAKRLPGRERIVAATLDLIVRNGGCRGVNLRQIAARARCAHTNAYNYFDSLEDLFWAALHQVLDTHFSDTEKALAAPAATSNPLRTLLENHVSFAQRNPGLYRLFWFEPLAGKPPAAVLQRFDQMRQIWVRILGERLKALRSRTDPTWAGHIVHGYLHGEVSKLIGRHAFVPQSADDRTRIIDNTLALVDLVAAAGPKPRARKV